MNDTHPDVALGAIEQYFYQVHNTNPLQEGEEVQLLRVIVAGDGQVASARERLVEAYQPFVLSIAKRYVRSGTSVDLLDLVQEGNLGLLQAVESYRPSSDAAFSTWAFTWVRGAILQSLHRDAYPIRLPVHKAQLLRRFDEAEAQLMIELGRQPTLGEVAEILQVAYSAVCELAILRHQQEHFLSLYASVDEEGQEPLTLADVIPEPVQSEEMENVVRDALQLLPDRERMVIMLRFGLENGEPLSQQQVAEQLGWGVSEVGMLDRRARMRLARLLQRRIRTAQDVVVLRA